MSTTTAYAAARRDTALAATSEALARADATLAEVPWDDAEAARLRTIQQAELAQRYAPPGAEVPVDAPSDIGRPIDSEEIVAALLLRVRGRAVGFAAVRDISGLSDEIGGTHPDGTGEVKRVFVDADHRGQGLSRVLMAEIEARAVAAGLRRLVLETGTQQPESIGLYLSVGFLPIARYGEYADAPDSRCFAKTLVHPLEVREVSWDHADAVELRRELHLRESTVRYPGLAAFVAAHGGYDAMDAALGRSARTTLVAYRRGAAVGCASAVEPRPGAPVGALEVKKVYVRPLSRRTGAARALLAGLETAAVALGREQLLWEVGTQQPEAVTLARTSGFRPVRPFPPYETDALALCFAKELRGA